MASAYVPHVYATVLESSISEDTELGSHVVLYAVHCTCIGANKRLLWWRINRRYDGRGRAGGRRGHLRSPLACSILSHSCARHERRGARGLQQYFQCEVDCDSPSPYPCRAQIQRIRAVSH